ncbi:MAG: hypothetical protein U0599_02585 [Vicinamibacteria bacterium]
MVGASGIVAPFLGIFVFLVGHLVLWVRSQTTSPGGATPAHEDVWAPVEDEWLARVEALEEKGARWDVTPWDISNGRGCLTLVALLGAIGAGLFVFGAALGPGTGIRLTFAAFLLFVPLWFNGMRTTWNPSELRKKGQALAVAREVAGKAAGTDFDFVPMLALREGRRGKYPVDARLMLRPTTEDESGFLGVQVQVSLNNVRGTDYPYLYCVVLGKDGFQLPSTEKRQTRNGVDMVFERGAGKGAKYLVVRQHADTSGGWHTEDVHIKGLVTVAIELGRSAWREAARKLPS